MGELVPHSAFLPQDRAAALTTATELPETAPGSVLFSDITGFVRLTSAMAEVHGPREGAELIAKHLNSSFEIIVAYVERYGGSVVSFSGDAITSFFPDDDGLRALAAAVFMRDAIRQEAVIQIGAQKYPLQVKSALSGGEVVRFIAGLPQVQRFDVMSGPAVARNAQLADRMQGDDIALDPELGADKIRSWASGHEEDRDGQKVFLVDSLRASVSPQTHPGTPNASSNIAEWLLSSLRDTLPNTEPLALAELKPICSLFLLFDGLDFNEPGHDIVCFQDMISSVQNLLQEFSGSLLQISTGEKGNYLLAAFGAPRSAGNDAERACACAFKLRELGKLHTGVGRIHIGLGHGATWVGAYGARRRMHYGVHGRQVNLAARLMQRADGGQILLSEAMANQIRPGFKLLECGEVPVKGERNTQAVYEAISRISGSQRREAMRSRSKLVGRDAERTMLHELLQGFGQSRWGEVLVIEGEPGIGKSRLVEFLLDEAEQQHIRSAFGAADAVELRTPYFVWREVMDSLISTSPAQTRQAWLSDKLAQMPALRNFGSLLNDTLNLDLAVHEDARVLSPAGRRETLNKLLSGLLAQCAREEALLLILEDAHWLDPASWGVIQALLDEKAPLSLVLASRPVLEQDQAYGALKRRAGTKTVVLGRMDREHAHQLMLERLGLEELAESARNLIEERAQGNPFFVEELSYSLRDHGHLRIADGSGTLVADHGELSLPDTVEGVIHSRIDQLTGEQQQTLKTASVIGRVFSRRLLCDIFPDARSPEAIAADLDVLERLDITPLEPNETERSYFFKHIITQDVAYSRMTRDQRGPIHRAVALWLEMHHASNLETQLPLLAYHWREADEIDRSLDYLERATQTAFGNGAFAAALAFAEQLLEHREQTGLEPGRVAAWEEHAAEASFCLGDLNRAQQHREQQLALLSNALPEDERALGKATLGALFRQALHRMQPSYFIGRDADRATVHLARARAYERLAEIHFVNDRTEQVLHASLNQTNAAELAGGDTPERLRSYAAISVTAQIMRLPGLRHTYESGSQEIANRIAHTDRFLESEGMRLHRRALRLLGDGELIEAGKTAEDSVQATLRSGDQVYQPHSLSLQMVIEFIRGDLVQGERLLTTYEPMAERFSDGQDSVDHSSVTLYQRAELCAQTADYSGAREHLRRLDEIVTRPVVRAQVKIWYWQVKSMLAMQSGDFDQAHNHLRQLLELLPAGLPFASYLLHAYSLQSEVCLREWESGAPVREPELKAAQKRMQVFCKSFAIAQPRLALLEGRQACLSGDSARGAKRLLEGLALARSRQMPLETGLFLLALHQHAIERPEADEGWKEDARASLLQANALADLERLAAIA